jgi:hypothetical protein
MQELLNLIQESYFSLVFMVIAQIITVFVCIQNRRKFKELNFFHWYPIVALLQSTVSLTSMVLGLYNSYDLISISISLFVVFEFLCIYFFAFRIVRLKRPKILLKVVFSAFLLYVLFMWTFDNAFHRHYQVFFIQASILLLPSLLYFYQIFVLPIRINPVNEPAFWINVGILFFSSSTIPLFILENYSRDFISHNRYLYSISYTAYGVFFLLICKAYLCKVTTRLDYSLS